MTAPRLTLEDYLRNLPQVEDIVPTQAAEDDLSNVRLKDPGLIWGGLLNDHDREWLKRLKNEPGYAILFCVANNIVLGFENSARVLSQADPLGNKDAIANAWAYAAIGKEVVRRLQLAVDEEAERAK